MNSGTALIIDQVDKSFPLPSEKGVLKVLEDVALGVSKGEIIAIVGPSGCGKSTLLNIVAGFEKSDRGLVLFMGKHVTAPSSERGVVFQSAVLFPWLNVKQNIAFGLKQNKEPKQQIQEKCRRFIQLVGLEGFEGYYPEQLSGGMQQRVALARVLVLEPHLLLLDEPFAALDAQTRMAMQQLLLSIVSELQPTVLIVTHDVDEALLLADKVYVMSKLPGRIIRQVKVDLARPRSLSVISTPKFSQLKGEILELLFHGNWELAQV